MQLMFWYTNVVEVSRTQSGASKFTPVRCEANQKTSRACGDNDFQGLIVGGAIFFQITWRGSNVVVLTKKIFRKSKLYLLNLFIFNYFSLFTIIHI